MAKNDTTNAPLVDFASLDGDNYVVSRPRIKWSVLSGRDNDKKDVVVCGYFIRREAMQNPKGAQRQDDEWGAGIVELTHPCRAIDGEKEIIAQPGTEVLVDYGSDDTDLGRRFAELQGLDKMFWLAIEPNGTRDIGGGKNPMRKFNVKIGGETTKFPPKTRTGKYLIGQKSVLGLGAPVGATAADGAAASTAVRAISS